MSIFGSILSKLGFGNDKKDADVVASTPVASTPASAATTPAARLFSRAAGNSPNPKSKIANLKSHGLALHHH